LNVENVFLHSRILHSAFFIDTMALSERALRTIRKHGLFPRGARVLVALSGGPDSVALVHILRELEAAGELAIAGLAHFNHRLRGESADEDERFCRDMAAALGLAFEAAGADIRAFARAHGRSLEDAARTLRYGFLETAADRLGADVIAVGHTIDDQAETFLLRLIRGAGPRGLGGIRPRAGRVVRPLLEIRRAELRTYAAERGLRFCEDATNADPGIPRNRVRHELIPYLERAFSPGITDVLAREAAIARDDEDHLHAEAIKLAATVVLEKSDDERVQLDADALRSLVPALAARVARIALEVRANGRFIGFEHIDRFLEFVRAGTAGAALSLPGQQATHRGTRVELGPAPGRPRSGEREGENSFRFPLSIPGEVLTTQGWAVSAEPLAGEGPPAGGWQARGDAVTVAVPGLDLPLAVRSRRPGDRFRPLGMRGGKKLQDFMVDRKIPREVRDALPLVVDAADRIVWVVGQSVSEDFRVADPSRGVILLKARRLGGKG
jgi:tRNA(Ile)-lysidine synthase